MTDFAVTQAARGSQETPITRRPAQQDGAEGTDAQGRFFRRLIQWVRARGGRAGAVTLITHDGLRSLELTSDVMIGEELLFIPRTCWLSEKSILPRSQKQCSAAAIGDISPRSRLAWLLCDTASPEHSDWHPYLATLPCGFESHPLGCEEDLLKYLPRLAEPIVREIRAEMRRDHEKLCKTHPEQSHPAFDSFAWAYCCVASRAFLDNAQLPNLIPLGDLLNHSFQPTCRLSLHADGAQIVAKQNLPAGTALTWEYVDAPNVILLVVYGFCVEDHPQDRTLLCGPAITDALALRLGADSMSMKTIKYWVANVPATFGDTNARGMLTAMRSIRRDPIWREDGAGRQDPSNDPHACTPANREEEVAVLRELRSLCGKWVEELEEVTAPSMHGDASARTIADMSSRLIRSNRRIIDHFSCMCDRAIPLLSTDELATARAGLADFPDTAYAAELLAHADRLWP